MAGSSNNKAAGWGSEQLLPETDGWMDSEEEEGEKQIMAGSELRLMREQTHGQGNIYAK